MVRRSAGRPLDGAARRGRPITAAVAVVVSLGLACACTSPSSSDRAVQPASTALVERDSGPLASGLEILDGSALIGTVFDYSDVSWWAVLRIEGDPRQAMDTYREQSKGCWGSPFARRPIRVRPRIGPTAV